MFINVSKCLNLISYFLWQFQWCCHGNRDGLTGCYGIMPVNSRNLGLCSESVNNYGDKFNYGTQKGQSGDLYTVEVIDHKTVLLCDYLLGMTQFHLPVIVLKNSRKDCFHLSVLERFCLYEEDFHHCMHMWCYCSRRVTWWWVKKQRKQKTPLLGVGQFLCVI